MPPFAVGGAGVLQRRWQMLRRARLAASQTLRLAASLSFRLTVRPTSLPTFRAVPTPRLAPCLMLCLGLLASGCSSSHFDAWQAHGHQLERTHGNHGTRRDYEDVLGQWTRSAKIYRALDNKMFISATYHAPAFRRAFASAFPDIYGHGGKITRRELVDLTGGVEQHHNFLLAIYTPDTRWNDIARDDSIWRMSLYSKSRGQDGGGEAEVAPDDILPIKMDENLRAVYPFINRFDKVYLVRFPLVDPQRQLIVGPETCEMVLRIASAMGVASMRWKISGVPDAMQVQPMLLPHPPHTPAP